MWKRFQGRSILPSAGIYSSQIHCRIVCGCINILFVLFMNFSGLVTAIGRGPSVSGQRFDYTSGLRLPWHGSFSLCRSKDGGGGGGGARIEALFGKTNFLDLITQKLHLLNFPERIKKNPVLGGGGVFPGTNANALSFFFIKVFREEGLRGDFPRKNIIFPGKSEEFSSSQPLSVLIYCTIYEFSELWSEKVSRSFLASGSTPFRGNSRKGEHPSLSPGGCLRLAEIANV